MAMEKIYFPRYRDLIDIQKRFQLYKENLGHAKDIPKNDEEIREILKFKGKSNEFDMLLDSISVEQLTQPDEIRVNPFDPSDFTGRKRSTITIPKTAKKLKTVANLIKYRGIYCETHRNRFLKYNKYKCLKIDVDNQNADIQPFEESLLTVRIYEPFKYQSNSNVRMKPKLSQEFLVLGSQYLTELRDKIYCQCNFGPFFDISKQPNAEHNDSTVDKPFDHGFFFITDTFYNDTRSPTHDYSEVIRKWAMKSMDVGDMHTASMENTQFKDLTVRLGFPQVYIHHGNCEHLIGISDIRLIGQDDVRTRKQYPLLRIISSTRQIFCMICGLSEATFIVTNSTVHVHDPTYLCADCFESYHYIDGKKVGEFQAYRYYGNRPVSQNL